VPGTSAEVIVAETGGDMARFATSAWLAAWAGLAPGDNEPVGKRKKAPTRKGDQHLRTAMVESAWATARTATRPGARFRRLARRFGKGNEKKAAVAVAHTLLCIAWAFMRYESDYVDAGTDYYERRDQRNREHLFRYHQQALARLGLQAILTEPADGSPPPALGTPPPATPARPPDPYRTSPAGHHSRLRRRCRAPGWGPKFRHRSQSRNVCEAHELPCHGDGKTTGEPAGTCRGIDPGRAAYPAKRTRMSATTAPCWRTNTGLRSSSAISGMSSTMALTRYSSSAKAATSSGGDWRYPVSSR